MMSHWRFSINHQQWRRLNRLLVNCSATPENSHSVRNVCNQSHFGNRWAAHWTHMMLRTPRIHPTKRGAKCSRIIKLLRSCLPQHCVHCTVFSVACLFFIFILNLLFNFKWLRMQGKSPAGRRTDPD